MTEPIMKQVSGDGVRINLAIWKGTGRPILCVHGITANCRCWDKLADVLAPHHHIMAMDLRGRGRSDKPDTGYSLKHHMLDINYILDNLGYDRVVVMGHSLGAFIGLALAAEYPQRVERLILVDGGGDLSADQMAKVFVGIKPALDRLGHVFPSKKAYMEKMSAAPYMQPWSEVIDRYYHHEIETVEGGVQTNISPVHIMEEAENVRKLDCAPFYPKIQCKVLILRATEGLLSQDDLLLPENVIKGMLQGIPQAERFDVVGTNHYGIVFQPHDARDQVILEFLTS